MRSAGGGYREQTQARQGGLIGTRASVSSLARVPINPPYRSGELASSVSLPLVPSLPPTENLFDALESEGCGGERIGTRHDQ